MYADDVVEYVDDEEYFVVWKRHGAGCTVCIGVYRIAPNTNNTHNTNPTY